MSNTGATVIALRDGRRATPSRGGLILDMPARAERVGVINGDRPIDLTIRWAGAVSALLLHGAAAALALWPDADPLAGYHGQFIEAIGVEIVSARAIEARDSKSIDNTTTAAKDVATKDGTPIPVAPAPEVQEPAPVRQTEVSKDGEALAEKPPQPEIPKAAEPNPSEGGVASRGLDNDQRISAATAAASPGAMQRYALQVRDALARSRPKGRGMRGTTTITFGISPTGKISFARVSNVSGHKSLDEATLKAVLGTSFPVPPAGLTEQQLTYVVPFQFK